MSTVAAKSDSPPLSNAAPISDVRSLLPWFAAEFLCSYAVNLYLIACYDFATDHLHGGMGASESQRLWVSSFWGFSYIFISLLAGRLAEKFGPRKAAISAAAFSAVTTLVALLAVAIPKIWLLPLVMLPFNFTCTLIWPAIESGVTRSPGKMRLSSRIALFNLSWGCAGFVSIASHGLLEQRSWYPIFITAAVTFAIASILLLRLGLPASMIGTYNVPDDAKGEHELDSPAMRRRAEGFLKMAWLANGLAYTAIYVLFPTMTQLAKMAYQNATGVVATAAVAGFITSVWFVTRFLGFGLTSIWTGWHYKVPWLLGPLALLAVTFCAMLTVHNLPAFLGLQILFGFAAALVFSGSLYYAMHVSSGHGGHAAFHEAVVGIGTTLGPVIGALSGTGELGDAALTRIAIGVTAIIILGMAAIAWMAARLEPAPVPASQGVSP